MKRIIIPITVLILVCLAYSCSSPKMASETKNNSSELLYKNKWYVTELQGKPFTFEGVNNNFAHLSFNAGSPTKVTGSTGCNRLTGTVTLSSNNNMQFSPLATTRMACPGGDIETSFLNALKTATSYNLSDSELVLNNGSTAVAKLKAVPLEMDKLSGTWQLNYLSGTRVAFGGLYPDKKPFIYFNFPQGSVGGNTTCNGFSAKYIIKENNIHFADPLKTMMFCEGGGEETFLSMLQKVNRYALSDTMLTFLTGDIAVMRFTKQ